jgi:hypothetical protein
MNSNTAKSSATGRGTCHGRQINFFRAPDAAQYAALAAWCAAEPGPKLNCNVVPALRRSVKNAAPGPGHAFLTWRL